MRYVNDSYQRTVIMFAALHAGLIREYLASGGDERMYAKLMVAKSAALSTLEMPDIYSFGSLVTDAINYVKRLKNDD